VAWTVNMGLQYVLATAICSSAKGVLLMLLADVYVFTAIVSVRKEVVRLTKLVVHRLLGMGLL
jgi:hypothetical protein